VYGASTTAIATTPVEIENLRSIFSTFSVQKVYIVVCVRLFGQQESMLLCWKKRAGQINTPCICCIAIDSLQNAGESDRFAEETALKSSDASLLSSSSGMVFLGNALLSSHNMEHVANPFAGTLARICYGKFLSFHSLDTRLTRTILPIQPQGEQAGSGGAKGTPAAARMLF
jgi:hypothetical protein